MLLAYAKLSLYGDLLESSVPDDPYLGRELSRYFPSQLVERYPDALEKPPPAARDHFDPAHQFDDQPRRAVVRGAHRRPDRRVGADDRGGVLRGAQQLRHDRAQRRDRCARQQGRPASCSSISTRRSRTCCSTASCGSCAMSTSRRGSPTWSSTIAPASRQVDGALNTVLPPDAARGAGGSARPS